MKMDRKEFLMLLAQFIQEDADLNPESPLMSEPYRAAGDRLVDEALEYID